MEKHTPSSTVCQGKILNFGSLNIDYVYRVSGFVRPGETVSAKSFQRFRGGKGLNQSIALVRAGAVTLHAGRIGKDGLFLKEYLEANGVNTDRVEVSETGTTGHAVIQVADSGENSIVIFGGTNRDLPETLIRRAMEGMGPGDFLLLQNEISPMEKIFRLASEKGLRIFFNPAPMTPEVKQLPLELAETLIVNETEGAALAEIPAGSGPEEVHRKLAERYPGQNILLTLGVRGCAWRGAGERALRFFPAVPAEKVVDTTAAGDTFIGYFLASLASGRSLEESLRMGAEASAVCVSRPGAADSIPAREELQICQSPF